MGVINEPYQAMQRAVSLGKLAGAGMLSTGRILLVKDANDPDLNELLHTFSRDDHFTDIQSALDVCSDDQNDYVLVCPTDNNTAWAQTANLDVKGTGKYGRFLHLIGLERGPNKPEISFAGAFAVRVGNGALTGARCRSVELANLRISASGTTNIHVLELGDSSGFTYDTLIRNCDISTTATTAAMAEIKDFSQQAFFDDCVLGQPSAHPDDIYLQGAGAAATGVTVFRNCKFIHFAAATADQYATIVAGANVLFQKCDFYNANHANFAIAVGVVSAEMAILANCNMLATTMATTAKSLVAPSGMDTNAALSALFNPGIMVDGAAPIAAATP